MLDLKELFVSDRYKLLHGVEGKGHPLPGTCASLASDSALPFSFAQQSFPKVALVEDYLPLSVQAKVAADACVVQSNEWYPSGTNPWQRFPDPSGTALLRWHLARVQDLWAACEDSLQACTREVTSSKRMLEQCRSQLEMHVTSTGAVRDLLENGGVCPWTSRSLQSTGVYATTPAHCVGRTRCFFCRERLAMDHDGDPAVPVGGLESAGFADTSCFDEPANDDSIVELSPKSEPHATTGVSTGGARTPQKTRRLKSSRQRGKPTCKSKVVVAQPVPPVSTKDTWYAKFTEDPRKSRGSVPVHPMPHSQANASQMPGASASQSKLKGDGLLVKGTLERSGPAVAGRQQQDAGGGKEGGGPRIEGIPKREEGMTTARTGQPDPADPYQAAAARIWADFLEESVEGKGCSPLHPLEHQDDRSSDHSLSSISRSQAASLRRTSKNMASNPSLLSASFLDKRDLSEAVSSAAMVDIHKKEQAQETEAPPVCVSQDSHQMLAVEIEPSLFGQDRHPMASLHAAGVSLASEAAPCAPQGPPEGADEVPPPISTIAPDEGAVVVRGPRRQPPERFPTIVLDEGTAPLHMPAQEEPIGRIVQPVLRRYPTIVPDDPAPSKSLLRADTATSASMTTPAAASQPHASVPETSEIFSKSLLDGSREEQAPVATMEQESLDCNEQPSEMLPILGVEMSKDDGVDARVLAISSDAGGDRPDDSLDPQLSKAMFRWKVIFRAIRRRRPRESALLFLTCKHWSLVPRTRRQAIAASAHQPELRQPMRREKIPPAGGSAPTPSSSRSSPAPSSAAEPVMGDVSANLAIDDALRIRDSSFKTGSITVERAGSSSGSSSASGSASGTGRSIPLHGGAEASADAVTPPRSDSGPEPQSNAFGITAADESDVGSGCHQPPEDASTQLVNTALVLQTHVLVDPDCTVSTGIAAPQQSAVELVLPRRTRQKRPDGRPRKKRLVGLAPTARASKRSKSDDIRKVFNDIDTDKQGFLSVHDIVDYFCDYLGFGQAEADTFIERYACAREEVTFDAFGSGYWVTNPYMITDRKDETIIRKPGSLGGQMLNLESLEGCSVYVCDVTAQMFVDYCNGCSILIAPCESSVFVRDCENCTFWVAAQQLRTNNCTNCTFYLYSKTEPIIETSKDLAFSPWAAQYPRCTDQFKRANFDPERNLWNAVFDFSGKKDSANWRILPLRQITELVLRLPEESPEIAAEPDNPIRTITHEDLVAPPLASGESCGQGVTSIPQTRPAMPQKPPPGVTRPQTRVIEDRSLTEQPVH